MFARLLDLPRTRLGLVCGRFVRVALHESRLAIAHLTRGLKPARALPVARISRPSPLPNSRRLLVTRLGGLDKLSIRKGNISRGSDRAVSFSDSSTEYGERCSWAPSSPLF
jgi:hypothetical protein